MIWDNAGMVINWIKIIYKEDNSVEQIRCLSKQTNPSCVVFTAKPEVSIYDLETNARL
jgi:hypothetical protein